MTFSVILPTLNERDHIVYLIKEISSIFKKKKISYEIIVVDDSSTDGTPEIVKKYFKKNLFIRLISRQNKKRNLAKSINEGIKISKNDYLIWMDADFQHPPKYIKSFIKEITQKKIIICSRFLKNSRRYFQKKNYKRKNINENPSIFFNKLCKFFLFNEITDYTSSYICIKKTFLKGYKLEGFYGDYFLNLIMYLKKKNRVIHEIPYEDEERLTGYSKTTESLNLNYLYTCLRYFFSLMNNIFKRFFF